MFAKDSTVGRGLLSLSLVLALATQFSAQERRGEPLVSAMHAAFAGMKGGAVVLSVESGKVLAIENREIVAQHVAAPGSTVKPFTLELLLRSGVLTSRERIACRRGLRVADVRLDCSHPEGLGPFDAREALSLSCNSYFVEAAKRLPAKAVEQQFRQLGFESATGLTRNEAQGHVASATTVEDRELLAIGARGVSVTPLELASAYRRVAMWQKSPTAAQKVVLEGLADATSSGLAQNAQPGNLRVAGKTGTAANRRGATTHGWFAGFAPAENPQIVVVVYVDNGSGSVEAARLARKIFEAAEPMFRSSKSSNGGTQ